MPFSSSRDSRALTRATTTGSGVAASASASGGTGITWSVVMLGSSWDGGGTSVVEGRMIAGALGVERDEVGLPHVEVVDRPGVGVGTPYLGRVEAHRVDVLGLLAQPMCVGVGEDESTVGGHDHATLPAQVARQAGVPLRVQVADEDPLAGREGRWGVDLAPGRGAGAQEAEELLHGGGVR